MIESFRCRESAMLYAGRRTRLCEGCERIARRKLRMLDGARELRDLFAPPGNRLEALGGDRTGQYSIRVNERWRICFEWNNGKARNVEIVDYR